MATAILVGAGVTLFSLGARAAIRTMRQTSLQSINLSSQKYLRGGFEEDMSSREALQILGVNTNAKMDELKKKHRAMMLNNHPDRGGSPYLASKINEAKELLDGKKKF